MTVDGVRVWKDPNGESLRVRWSEDQVIEFTDTYLGYADHVVEETPEIPEGWVELTATPHQCPDCLADLTEPDDRGEADRQEDLMACGVRHEQGGFRCTLPQGHVPLWHTYHHAGGMTHWRVPQVCRNYWEGFHCSLPPGHAGYHQELKDGKIRYQWARGTGDAVQVGDTVRVITGWGHNFVGQVGELVEIVEPDIANLRFRVLVAVGDGHIKPMWVQSVELVSRG